LRDSHWLPEPLFLTLKPLRRLTGRRELPGMVIVEVSLDSNSW
jgi:hypothetical protein